MRIKATLVEYTRREFEATLEFNAAKFAEFGAAEKAADPDISDEKVIDNYLSAHLTRPDESDWITRTDTTDLDSEVTDFEYDDIEPVTS